MPASRPNLIVDGKLDHTATTAELRHCIDPLIRNARFELAYEIRTTGPAAAAELENPEILVLFRGRDQDLLLERNAELLKALEHIALRWLWLDPQFYGRIRFDAGGYRAIRIEELKLSARVAADLRSCALALHERKQRRRVRRAVLVRYKARPAERHAERSNPLPFFERSAQLRLRMGISRGR